MCYNYRLWVSPLACIENNFGKLIKYNIETSEAKWSQSSRPKLTWILEPENPNLNHWALNDPKIECTKYIIVLNSNLDSFLRYNCNNLKRFLTQAPYWCNLSQKMSQTSWVSLKITFFHTSWNSTIDRDYLRSVVGSRSKFFNLDHPLLDGHAHKSGP